MKNLELLNFCKKYPEPFFDLHYSKKARELVISRDKNSPNDLQRANALIRRNITALEALLGKNEKAAELKLAAEMVDALEQEGINNSEFTSYWEVNDVSVSIYRRLQKQDQYKFVLEMAKRYIQDRHELYSAYGYSDTTLQVKADSFAHKRSGGQGQTKVLAMLARFGMPVFENIDLGEFIKSLSENPCRPPSNDGAGEMQERLIAVDPFLPSDEDAAETIEPGVRTLDDPTAGAVARDVLLRGGFFAPAFDVRNVSELDGQFPNVRIVISSVQA